MIPTLSSPNARLSNKTENAWQDRKPVIKELKEIRSCLADRPGPVFQAVELPRLILIQVSNCDSA